MRRPPSTALFHPVAIVSPATGLLLHTPASAPEKRADSGRHCMTERFHTIEAKGFLVKDPSGDRLNVVSLTTLNPACQ